MPADRPLDAAGLQPSIQFEEAEAHRNDKIAFTPGARVIVPFTPRTSDRWPVGGVDPATLPAGRLDGHAMRRETNADPAPIVDPSIDTPNADPRSTVFAEATSWRPSAASSDGLTPPPLAPVSLAGLRREIFGFLPYWQVNSSTLRLDYSKLSTIAYFGVGADETGHLVKRNPDGSTAIGWSGWTSSKMTSILSAAHHNHTRVVLTVQSFGWNTSGLDRQKALLGSSTSRLRLARQIAAAVRDRGADGVNLDFEPLAAGYASQFTALVRSIRAELNRIHRGYQITFDTTGSIGNYPIEDATAAGGADAIFIMGYDYRSSSSSPVGSIAPLDRNAYDIRATVGAYVARVPASKLILGVPYYGRAWSTATDQLNASNTSGAKFGASTAVIYSTAADYLAQYGRRYDGGEKVAWTAYRRQNCTATFGCVTSWRQIYVDDGAALRAKYDVVNAYGLRGAGIWALGYDGTRTDLWQAIQQKFINDTTAPTVGIRTMAARQANPGFTVAWAGRDDVAVKSYDVQASIDGRPWVAWITSTRAGSATWFGIDGHSYAFRVRGHDPKGNVSTWNVTSASVASAPLGPGSFGIVRIDGLSLRSAGDPGATKVGTLSSGDVVAITAGPRIAGGYTWFQVKGPLAEWGAVRPVTNGAWVAASSASATYVSPTKPPNTTRVDAFIRGVGFGGGGGPSIGSAPAAIASRSFSPNRDGSKDTLFIDWTNQVALDTLVLKVFRANGTLIGAVPLGSHLAAGPQHVAWDGRVHGAVLRNSRYLATLVGTAAGRTYFNPSPAFLASAMATFGVVVDTVAPVISTASASGSLLSPNGDRLFDTVRVAIRSTGATGWIFSARPLSGSRVGPAVVVRTGSGSAPSVTWDGRLASGALAPSGAYRLTLAAIDSAGNRTSRSWPVRLDTIPPVIASSAGPARFTPNGDGVDDTTRLAWSASEPISGTARILRGTTVVRSWPISKAVAGAVSWAGTDAAGHRAADGTYTYRVSGRDAAGNASSRSIPVVVDRTLSTLRWNPALFFPQDGDALAATSRVGFRLARTSWTSMAIYQGSTLVRAIWTNRLLTTGSHAWTWNGRNAAGVPVPRGPYTVWVSATSAIGTSILTRTVVVDAFSMTPSARAVRRGQTLTVTFTTAEPLRLAPTVTFTQKGRGSATRTAISLGGGRYRVAFLVRIGSGPAVIRVTGRDAAGGINTSSSTITVR